jgi:hypothetical protein
MRLAQSSMEQVEVVRRTREVFGRSGRVPRVDVDPSARPVKLGILNFANRLLKVVWWEDLTEEERAVRGFYSKFATTMANECVLTKIQAVCLA